MTVAPALPAKADHAMPRNGQDLDDYLRRQSDEDLVATKLDLQEDMAGIDSQLELARRGRPLSKVWTSDDPASRDWFHRAMDARRIKAGQYNATCAEQGRRNRERASIDRTHATFHDTETASPAELRFLRAFLLVSRQGLIRDRFGEFQKGAREIAAQWKEQGVYGPPSAEVEP